MRDRSCHPSVHVEIASFIGVSRQVDVAFDERCTLDIERSLDGAWSACGQAGLCVFRIHVEI